MLRKENKLKVILQQQRDFYSAFMGEQFCTEPEIVSKEELDKAIEDCRSMLQYSIDQNWKEEISYWRKLLQENKCKRRMLTA